MFPRDGWMPICLLFLFSPLPKIYKYIYLLFGGCMKEHTHNVIHIIDLMEDERKHFGVR